MPRKICSHLFNESWCQDYILDKSSSQKRSHNSSKMMPIIKDTILISNFSCNLLHCVDRNSPLGLDVQSAWILRNCINTYTYVWMVDYHFFFSLHCCTRMLWRLILLSILSNTFRDPTSRRDEVSLSLLISEYQVLLSVHDLIYPHSATETTTLVFQRRARRLSRYRVEGDAKQS
jgi:hypothetical protein